MEIPVAHEHSRPVKKPVAASRNVSRPTAPPPPVRPGPAIVNGVSSTCHGGNKSRGSVQTIPFHKASEVSVREPPSIPGKPSSTRPSRGNTPPSSAPSSSSSSSAAKSTTKPATNTATAKSSTNSQFLKLATTRSSPGPKPKLPTKPAALRDNPTLILARKSGAGPLTNNLATAAAAGTSGPATQSKSSTLSTTTVSQPQRTTSKTQDKYPPISLTSEPGDQEKKNWFSVRSLSSPGKPAAPGTGGKLYVQGPPSRQTSLHARLPSTDSGIQADGGFDSLSRYKGKSFLSDSSATFDSLEGSDELLSNFSSISPNAVDADTVFRRETDRSVNNSIDGISKRKSLGSEITDGHRELHKNQQLERKNSSDFQNSLISHNTVEQTSVNTNLQTSQPSSIKPTSKRPHAAPRPFSSPPPAPVSVTSSSASGVSSSIPVVKRPPRNRPNMHQPTWRHSAGGPPSRGQDVHGHRKSLAEPPQLNPDTSSGISHRPFPQRVIKTLRSTSLENFSNILGENITTPVNPSDSQTMSRISSSHESDGVEGTSFNLSTQACTLPRSTSRSPSSKPQAYMTVSPPPPPNPQLNARRISAPLSTADFSQIEPTNERFPLNFTHGVNTTDNVNSAPSQYENTGRAVSPPRLHPSIKAFTNHHGAVHVTTNKTSNIASSNSSAKTVSREQPLHSSAVPSSAKTTESDYVNVAYNVKNHTNPEVFYENIDSVGKREQALPSGHKGDVGLMVNGKASSGGNSVLTRPLRIVAAPGKLDAREHHHTPLAPPRKDAVSNGLQGSKDLSNVEKTKQISLPVSLGQLAQSDFYPHRDPKQAESKDKRVRPSVTPRTKVQLSDNQVGSSSEIVPRVKVVGANKDSQSTPIPITISTDSRAPAPSQRHSLPDNHGSNFAPQEPLNANKRMEIPVTHFRTEDTDSSSKLSNILTSSSKTVRSPSVEMRSNFHRTKDDIRKNADCLRPLSLSFPNSPSLLSPSSHFSTLPKNSSFKRDVRSPYRSLLSSRQNEERQKQKDAIYENVRTKLRDNFRFEDDASRFRHDDLLLKETDELMKEALEVLNNSSLPHSLSPSLSSSSSFSQRFFPSPMSSSRRRERIRSTSSSEDKENPIELAILPKSPIYSIAPSSPTSKVFSEIWKNSEKENSINNANSIYGSSTGASKTSISDFNPTTTEENGTSIPFYDVRSGKFYDNGKDVTPVGSPNGVLPEKTKGELTSPPPGDKSNDVEVTWSERKARMDSALSWLKTELAALRDMDNTLICQFKRCQDTIETLKTQRDVWEGLSEEGEECEYWDDYEINEFNKKYLDSPGGSSTSQLSLGSRNSSLYDVTSVSTPRLALPGERRGSKGQIVTQDVEATV